MQFSVNGNRGLDVFGLTNHIETFWSNVLSCRIESQA